MRVTSQMLANEAVKNINGTFTQVLKYQNQMTTGKKYTRPSEDPYNANKSLYLSSRASRVQQFTSTVNDSRNILSETETALSDIDDSLQNIKDLVSQASNGSMSISERESICQEIEQNKQQILYSLNASGTTGYLFGGYNTNTKPLVETGGAMTYNGVNLESMTDLQMEEMSSEKIAANINTGITMNVTMTALDITGKGSDNMLSNIDDIMSALRETDLDSSKMTTLSKTLEGHFDHVLVRLSEVGGKMQRLDKVKSQLKDSSLSISDMLSESQDAEVEETVIRYKMAEQAYQAALTMSGSSVQMTLLDYLD